MKKRLTSTTKALLAALLLLTGNYLHAQVTIGNGSAPTYGALLDLKSQQAGTVTAVDDDANITSTKGGLLLPRVKLLSFTSLDPVMPGGDALTAEEKLKLAGLMIYNINVSPNDALYLGLYLWNGNSWEYLTDSRTPTPVTAKDQPKSFTFYETDLVSVTPLTFTANPPRAVDGTPGTILGYQWYQVTSNNVHIKTKIGLAISGATDSTYTPDFVLKGPTNNANNVGFYRFYCVATGSDGSSVQSDVAEIAVGCGAKDNLGEWISFMCFNLGAQNNISIQQQKDFSLSFTNPGNIHTYIPGEENLYGSLFQWGRIPDGHELRLADNSNIRAYSGITRADIASGLRCTSAGGIPSGNHYPTNQVKEGTNWYGKFIYGSPTPAYNWNPIDVQSTLDVLWSTGGFLPNDPCMHYKADGTFKNSWHTAAYGGTDGSANSDACDNSGTAWRTPTQPEWGAIYRTGTLYGTPEQASANTWQWYANGSNTSYEIKPDGQTTTLLLPASGSRTHYNGAFYGQGATGYYGSSSVIGVNSYNLYFYSGSVSPAFSYARGDGMALRCIKN